LIIGIEGTSPPSPRLRARRAAFAAGAVVLALCAWFAARNPHLATAAPGDSNVVLIVTDDQTLEEMQGLPQTSALIGAQGVTFNRAYVNFPLCCPSRAAMLTGQYMHNHGVRGNGGEFGGWQRFVGTGAEANALPNWLEDAGYYNVEIGKYMNGYGDTGGNAAPIPPGWDEWYAKYSEYDDAVKGSRIYFNYMMREDPPATGGVPCPSGDPPAPGDPFTCVYGEEDPEYQTDVVREKAVEAIDRLSGPSSPQTPFFLKVDFNSPHSPYVPAPRNLGAQAATAITPPPASNEKDISDKPRFLRRLPKLGKGKLTQIANRRRSRLEMLMSVDDAVVAIMDKLEDEGQLGDTYVIFTSDNGYFSGEHRIRQGKYLPHEPSSHVPLLIRGPGIPAGASSDALVANTDIPTTISEIAGATPSVPQDGLSLLPFATAPGSTTGRGILLEGDTGPSIDDDGTEQQLEDDGDAARLEAFYKKRRAQKRKLKARCSKLKAKSPKLAIRCMRRGVDNLDQEPTDATYKLNAPAFTALRSDRYLLTLYSTGELELYDMAHDPGQLKSLHRNPRFKWVRKWMLAKLAGLSNCAGPACSASLGTEPLPLPKKPKPKRKKPA
jgi:N-acetylglucosamine-6-sulfatase